MPWTTSIPDSLWSRTDPIPAYIIFDGINYNLTVEPASGGSGASVSEASFAAVDTDYIAYATNLLAKTFTVTPNLPSLAMPNDGEIIAISTANGLYLGVYDAADSLLNVTQAAIPVSEWLTWTLPE